MPDRARLSAAAAALALVLGGCAGEGALPDASGDDRGYISGDGTTREIALEDRGDPVEVRGEVADGSEVDLASLRGDVVVVNVWYATCPPCRAEAPDLVDIAAETAADGVQFVGINTRDDAATAQAFERSFEIGWPSIIDASGDAVLSLRGQVPPQAVPTTLVVDRQGRIAARILGQADPSTLRTLIEDAVAEPA